MEIDVDAGGVQGAGGDACALAQRLRAIRSAWDGATREPESACGLPVVRDALRALQDVWFTEVGAHATVLEQLCESTGSYQRTDQAARSLEVPDGGQ